MLKAKLVVVGGDAQAQEVKLKLPAVIGRGKEATLKVPLALISRRHCEICEREGRLYIRDLGSLNGTYVNNYKITAEQPLLPGELVTVGTITFRAEYQLEPQPAAKLNSGSSRHGAGDHGAGDHGAGENGAGDQEAVVFKPAALPGKQSPARSASQLDSTVAGMLAVTVAPGQPFDCRKVDSRKSAPAAAADPVSTGGGQQAQASAPGGDQAPPAKGSQGRNSPTARRRPVASPSPAAGPGVSEKFPKAKQPKQQTDRVGGGLVLDDFPLECSPQKSISLSALNELTPTGPRQVSFIGDLNFGEQPRRVVEEGVSIDLGSAVRPDHPSADDANSRLDSFLRGVERPAD